MSAGEYRTGMIRSTLAAFPRRLPVLWSKAAVIGATALVLTTVGALAAFGLGTVGRHGQSIALSLGDSGVLRSLAGAGVYLGLVAVFGVALGALLRSTAGGVAALAGILLILPGLASLLPTSWYDTVKPYFPSDAGPAIYSVHQPAHQPLARGGAGGLRRLGGADSGRHGPSGWCAPTPDQRTGDNTVRARWGSVSRCTVPAVGAGAGGGRVPGRLRVVRLSRG